MFGNRWIVAICAVLASLALLAPAAQADTGILKLKVQHCVGSYWVVNGQVNVALFRPGVGQISSDSGSTNSVGYIEFTYYGLQEGDIAYVTITPQGLDPDNSHTYEWACDGGKCFWDITGGGSECQDGWYATGVILCSYH